MPIHGDDDSTIDLKPNAYDLDVSPDDEADKDDECECEGVVGRVLLESAAAIAVAIVVIVGVVLAASAVSALLFPETS